MDYNQTSVIQEGLVREMLVVVGGVSGKLSLTVETEEQVNAPPLLDTKADSKVESLQLLGIAKKVAGFWDELAAWLSPEIFSTAKVEEIQQHRRDFTQASYVEQYELWRDKLDSKATCRLLIKCLCQMVKEEWQMIYLVLTWFSLLILVVYLLTRLAIAPKLLHAPTTESRTTEQRASATTHTQNPGSTTSLPS